MRWFVVVVLCCAEFAPQDGRGAGQRNRDRRWNTKQEMGMNGMGWDGMGCNGGGGGVFVSQASHINMILDVFAGSESFGCHLDTAVRSAHFSGFVLCVLLPLRPIPIRDRFSPIQGQDSGERRAESAELGCPRPKISLISQTLIGVCPCAGASPPLCSVFMCAGILGTPTLFHTVPAIPCKEKSIGQHLASCTRTLAHADPHPKNEKPLHFYSCLSIYCLTLTRIVPRNRKKKEMEVRKKKKVRRK